MATHCAEPSWAPHTPGQAAFLRSDKSPAKAVNVPPPRMMGIFLVTTALAILFGKSSLLHCYFQEQIKPHLFHEALLTAPYDPFLPPLNVQHFRIAGTSYPPLTTVPLLKGTSPSHRAANSCRTSHSLSPLMSPTQHCAQFGASTEGSTLAAVTFLKFLCFAFS